MKVVRRAALRGFTLLELLVVIGIIVLLISILLPVVAQVRIQAQSASTQSQLSRIMTACQMYYHDFGAYPGPVANTYLSGGKGGTDPNAIQNVTGTITSSENLVLGLFGMLTPPTTAGGSISYTAVSQSATTPTHDVLSLNPLHPASYHYIDFVPDELSTGPSSALNGQTQNMPYISGAATPTDSTVPEFVDRFPDYMPILYFRAFPGAPDTASGSTDTAVQYNWNELKDYISFVHPLTGSPVAQAFTKMPTGTLADDEATAYTNWYSATPGTNSYYLNNPNIYGSVRGKNTFILISAGKDRTYGTQDDLIVTP